MMTDDQAERGDAVLCKLQLYDALAHSDSAGGAGGGADGATVDKRWAQYWEVRHTNTTHTRAHTHASVPGERV